jgi:hypothetical protein
LDKTKQEQLNKLKADMKRMKKNIDLEKNKKTDR